MLQHCYRLAGCTALVLALVSAPALAGSLVVTATAPAMNAGNVARDATVAITFDQPVQTASVTTDSVRVWGRSGGRMAGSFSFSNGGRTVTFDATQAFFPGEQINVNLTEALTGADGSPMRTGGYAYQFITVAGVAPMRFTKIDTVSVRTNNQPTRLYGGAFPDINNDGWIDYVAVNEVSFDLRVLLNRADGSGRLGPVLVPPRGIGQEASPNEAVDFDWDGDIDMATSNTSSNSVSVVIGNGDGTFAPQQALPVANAPHGLAALDVDGDGDLDLVAASESGNTLNLLLNNGSGVFSTAGTFDSGGNGEYSLAAGDMNEDGLTDLVVGTRLDSQVHVMVSNGNGGFTRVSNRGVGGATWMMATGDVNGDGHLDVSSVNGGSGNGSILLGLGNGNLQAPVISTFGQQMVATDLGDLDGDGDLDWVASSYGAARWYIMRNDGAGVFTPAGQVMAPQNGSCASLYDFDNDGDLDMALADETADVILLMRNEPEVIFADDFEL